MTDYEINVDIHRWKKGDKVSELELLSEGIDISKWVTNNLLVKPKVEVNPVDLNKDGVADEKDSKTTSETLNYFKKNKNKKVM